jgi:hypothetical protein
MAIVAEEQVRHGQQAYCSKISTDSNYTQMNNIKMTNVQVFFLFLVTMNINY